DCLLRGRMTCTPDGTRMYGAMGDAWLRSCETRTWRFDKTVGVTLPRTRPDGTPVPRNGRAVALLWAFTSRADMAALNVLFLGTEKKDCASTIILCNPETGAVAGRI